MRILVGYWPTFMKLTSFSWSFIYSCTKTKNMKIYILYYFLTPKVSCDFSLVFIFSVFSSIFNGGNDWIFPNKTIFINTTIFKDILKDHKPKICVSLPLKL